MTAEDLKKYIIELITTLDDPRVTKPTAHLFWQLFHDLKEQGFTEDQAMQIVLTASSQTKQK